jgi:galactoside O-acetyltransferase
MGSLTKQGFNFKSLREIYVIIWRKLRLAHYRRVSDARNIHGKPIVIQPVVLKGPGYIEFGKNVRFGVTDAPEFFSTYCLLNARKSGSKILFGNNIVVNNHFSAISEGEGITIGDGTIIGVNVSIMDTDFHSTDPGKRLSDEYETMSVFLGQNVWIGNNVMILKGSSIGANSIIAAGSVVTSNIPSNVIAGGIPCKIIKEIS